MSRKPVLILGARSDIARAVAHRFAREGHPLQLAARNAQSLTPDKADIEARHGVAVTLHEFDALATETHASFAAGLAELPEIAVCAVGYMGDQKLTEHDMHAAALVMRSNYEGPASILAELANHFERRGQGTLVGISSMAGVRGRASNYVYGSAKAGFTAFLSGLRNRLAKTGVHVVSILPGFVATRMTESLNLPARLTWTPEQVAEIIFTAVQRGRSVAYTGLVWRLIALVLVHVPESIFKRSRV